MISGIILLYTDDPEPHHCDDLFTFQSPHPPDTLFSLEAKVDTRDLTLSFLGDLFPQIRKLRLNNSIIPSVRDIGCTLISLRFLSLARCNLTSLDGISTISQNLEELYLAFNQITDVCDLMGMEKLTVVDLEDNHLSNIENIQILALCPKLKALTLIGNPAADIPEYRAKVHRILPQLVYLDEKRIVAKEKKRERVLDIPRLPLAEKGEWRDEVEGNAILTEQIDDIVEGRPPTARGFYGKLKVQGIGSSPEKTTVGGMQRMIAPILPRIVRPMSARG